MADSSSREPLVWLAVELNFWVLYLHKQGMHECLPNFLKGLNASLNEPQAKACVMCSISECRDLSQPSGILQVEPGLGPGGQLMWGCAFLAIHLLDAQVDRCEGRPAALPRPASLSMYPDVAQQLSCKGSPHG